MEIDTALESLFVVLLLAAFTPIVTGLLPGPRIPQVVVFLVGGVVIGPEVLGLGSADSLTLFSEVGLGFLFLLAGYEVDPKLIREPVMKLAASAWFLSVAISLVVTGVLYATGLVSDYFAIAIGLTTTALGTILPIVRDAGMLGGRLGRPILANGAIGEFAPIVAMALLLGSSGKFVALVTIALFGLLAVLVLTIPRRLVPAKVTEIIAGGSEETSQTTLRWVIVMLLGLLLVAGALGLDVILGAFAAGVVLRLTRPRDIQRLEHKLDAVGYGFFIPIYFIVSGMNLDILSIIEDPQRLLLFFALLVLVRGGSVYIVHRSLPGRERRQLALLSATALPLLVALSQVGMESGHMQPHNAAALVGAGVLSVLIFPMLATRGEAKRQAAEPVQTTGG
jgi:Kef-type K+ transport system membrane component KefB